MGGSYCSWDAVVDVAAENVVVVVVDAIAAATAAVADVVAADMVSAAAAVVANSMEAQYCKILIQFDIVAVAADSMPTMG